MRHRLRFTIRDVLLWTAIISLVCGCLVNSLELVDRLVIQCDKTWDQLSTIQPPLMGRDSVPAEWRE